MAEIRRWTETGLALLTSRVLAVAFVLLVGRALPACAQQPDPPGQCRPDEEPEYEAYLFAHMMFEDYGRMYYSVSLDALHWQMLNRGQRVLDDYRGHPNIVKGHDEQYYLVGNRSDRDPNIDFWVSQDLIAWEAFGDFTPDLTQIDDYPTAMPRIGAPKLFYDAAGSQYVLTWHTPHRMERDGLPEPYWASQRTLYATSADLRTFSPPARLFDWDMATIDVVLLKEGDMYFAILKDERYPTLEWVTGKSIRIATSRKLLGPYSDPGPPISPSFREAPTVIPSPNGQNWYLYYEQYPGVSYGLSVSDSLAGDWFEISGNTNFRDWDKYQTPPRARHGSMLPISLDEYEALRKAFPPITRGGPQQDHGPS